MQAYDFLVDQAAACGLTVTERTFLSGAKGLIKGNKIGIRKEMITIEKTCTLIEEIAHHVFTVGNILDQSDIRNRKQELLARQWAYQCMIPLDHIVQAHKNRISGRYDLSEFLGVTEEFLQSAIDRYTSKYGLYVKVNEWYTIQFEPLKVIERQY